MCVCVCVCAVCTVSRLVFVHELRLDCLLLFAVVALIAFYPFCCHQDLATRNILLNQEGTCKVSDMHAIGIRMDIIYKIICFN